MDVTLCSDTAIRERAYFDLEQGLLQNKTLHHLGFAHIMDEETPLHQASMFLEGGVSGLESFNRNANMFDYHEPLPSSITAQLEAVLKNCEQLHHAGRSFSLIDSRDHTTRRPCLSDVSDVPRSRKSMEATSVLPEFECTRSKKNYARGNHASIRIVTCQQRRVSTECYPLYHQKQCSIL
jgi:hypothetical protein